MRHANVAFFVPHFGCPYACSFCDQRSISGQSGLTSADEVTETCQKAAEHLAGRDFPAEIAFFGGSFTAIDRSVMTELLQAAYPFVQNGSFDGIRLSTRPDAVDQQVLSVLKTYGVTTVELGAQSMDDGVLMQNKRGHSAYQVEKASALIRAEGFSLGLQMMLGLDGDTAEKSRLTAQKIAALQPDCVRIYPTLVVEGTDLARRYRAGQYVPLSLEEAVEQTVWLLSFFEERNIEVIRIGLHSETTLQSSCIAGPIHPAFGELCYSRLWLKKAEKELKERFPKGTEVAFFVPEKDLSKAIGQKKENLRRLAQTGYPAKVIPDPELPKGAPFRVKEVKPCI